MNKFEALQLAHIGLVVDDINNHCQKMANKFGVGRFEIYDWIPDLAIVNNKRVKPFQLKIAMGEFKNGIKLELIQPINDHGFYSSFLKRVGNGINHLAFYVANIDKWRKYCVQNNYQIEFEAKVQDEVRGRRHIFYTRIEGLSYFYEFAQFLNTPTHHDADSFS